MKICYIFQNGSDEGWENSDELIDGVNWAISGTSVTHGIHVWNKIFPITNSDGKDVSICTEKLATGKNPLPSQCISVTVSDFMCLPRLTKLWSLQLMTAHQSWR